MFKLRILSLTASLVLGFSVVAVAQEAETGKEDGRGSIVKVQRWTIKKEVNNLTKSMKQFNGLIGSLNKANKDLGESFKKYMKNPNNDLLSSEVERKLAAYAVNVSKEFDQIIASQDVFTSNFRNLRHKLGQLEERLKGRSVQYRGQLLDYKKKTRDYEKQLIDLATRIKEPDIEPEEREQLKRDFALIHRRYKMQQRYYRGYMSRYKGYLKLQNNMGALSKLFSGLHTKFEDLIRNLENEKKFLRDSIELQVDTLRIKKLLEQDILGGEQALVNVSKKLATLYVKVDTFNSVHDRISSQMNQFLDSQGSLLSVTDKINAIGTTGIEFGTVNTNIDKLIDDFSKRDSIDVEDSETLPELTTPKPKASSTGK